MEQIEDQQKLQKINLTDWKEKEGSHILAKNTVELSQAGKEYRDQTRKRGNLTTRNKEFGGVIEIVAKNT